jgi:hypothetical protein
MAIGGHHNPVSKTETWLTPPYILSALGPFDLDPCAAEENPTWAAPRGFTKFQDGLAREWHGRVWMNPPYGAKVGYWMKRLAAHGDGIALIFARTETDMFFETVWQAAHALFFFRGRINFCFPNGTVSPSNAGAPSVLVAYGEQNEIALRASGLDGITLSLKNRHKG